jgi:hypothetical protein
MPHSLWEPTGTTPSQWTACQQQPQSDQQPTHQQRLPTGAHPSSQIKNQHSATREAILSQFHQGALHLSTSMSTNPATPSPNWYERQNPTNFYHREIAGLAIQTKTWNPFLPPKLHSMSHSGKASNVPHQKCCVPHYLPCVPSHLHWPNRKNYALTYYWALDNSQLTCLSAYADAWTWCHHTLPMAIASKTSPHQHKTSNGGATHKEEWPPPPHEWLWR